MMPRVWCVGYRHTFVCFGYVFFAFAKWWLERRRANGSSSSSRFYCFRLSPDVPRQYSECTCDQLRALTIWWGSYKNRRASLQRYTHFEMHVGVDDDCCHLSDAEIFGFRVMAKQWIVVRSLSEIERVSLVCVVLFNIKIPVQSFKCTYVLW